MNCYKCATPLPDHSKFCMACGADVSGEGHMHSTVGTDADPELQAALQAELGDDYTVERELGRGGMAIVYLGKDNHLGRKVAIKLLPPMLTFGSGPGLIERFKREARTSATLDHPHIIPVYRVSTGGKLFWYVMKFLQGESLDEMLSRDGALEVDKAVEILKQAADALDFAHQSGVVHRDVKPANMMMDKKGWVTVTDFGIAKALNTGTLTGTGSAIGTPHFMAPEQYTGVGVSGASDQYSLGVTAYQLLCAQLPFSADSLLELMRMHSFDPPPPLNERRPGLNLNLVAAVERALSKEPSERFPSCTDFVRELQRWAREDAARLPTAAAQPIAPTVAEPKRPHAVVKGRADTPVVSPAKGAARKGAAAPAKSRRTPFILGGVVAASLAAAFLAYKTLSPPVTSPTTLTPAETTKTPVAGDTNAGRSTSRANPDTNPVGATGTTGQTGSTGTLSSEDATKSAAPPPRTQPNPAPAGRRQTSGKANSPVASNGKTSGAAKPESLVTAPAVPALPALITVASRPSSAITINGKPVPGNPVADFEVPSGRVLIRFQVTDTAGVWSVDTVITVTPGERKNLGRIVLRRP
jgi:serine/threonine protein kinase